MKKLLAFSLLFALSAANAQAAGWLNPYVGIDYAYTNASYGNYTDKALKDQTDSYVLSAGIKILPGLAVEGFYQQSAHEKKHLGKRYPSRRQPQNRYVAARLRR